MAEQGRGGVRYIIWGAIAIIALLITLKELGFTPSKITTPAVSVELSSGLAPKDAGQNNPAPAQNTAQLESRVRELETQLAARGPQVAAPSNASTMQDSPQQTATPNVAGNWRGDPLALTITQYGNNVITQTFVYGAITAVGQGVLNGNTLDVSYVNNLYIQGKFQSTVSPDGRRMDLTDSSGMRYSLTRD